MMHMYRETPLASASCRLKAPQSLALHSHGVLLKDLGYKGISDLTPFRGVVFSKNLPRRYAHAGLCIINSRLLVLQSENRYVPLGTYPISLCITVSDFTPKVMKYTTYTVRDKGGISLLDLAVNVAMMVGLLPKISPAFPMASNTGTPSEVQSEQPQEVNQQ